VAGGGPADRTAADLGLLQAQFRPRSGRPMQVEQRRARIRAEQPLPDLAAIFHPQHIIRHRHCRHPLFRHLDSSLHLILPARPESQICGQKVVGFGPWSAQE
jgi:hypothetical protein